MRDFDYTKNWTNPIDFPTIETSEQQVRKDMQCLFDEIKNALNATSAADVAYEKPDDIPFVGDVDTVAKAIYALYKYAEGISREASGLTTGAINNPEYFAQGVVNKRALGADSVDTDQICEGAVTEGKLHADSVKAVNIIDGQVTKGKLGAGAVETANIEDYQVSANKLMANSVTGDSADNMVTPDGKIANNAVRTRNIHDGSVTHAKLATDAVENGNIHDSTIEVGKLTTAARTVLKNEAVAAGREEFQPKRSAVTLTLTPGFEGSVANVTEWTVPCSQLVQNQSAVIITPAPDSFKVWQDCNIYCQGEVYSGSSGSLKFKADTAPAVPVYVNALILN